MTPPRMPAGNLGWYDLTLSLYYSILFTFCLCGIKMRPPMGARGKEVNRMATCAGGGYILTAVGAVNPVLGVIIARSVVRLVLQVKARIMLGVDRPRFGLLHDGVLFGHHINLPPFKVQI